MVSKIRIEGPIVKEVTSSGHGGHVIVPISWIGKTVRVTIIDDQQQAVEETVKSKEELKSDYNKFRKNVRAAARLAKKNVKFSESSQMT